MDVQLLQVAYRSRPDVGGGPVHTLSQWSSGPVLVFPLSRLFPPSA